LPITCTELLHKGVPACHRGPIDVLPVPTDEPLFRVFTPGLWSVVDGEPVGVIHAAHHESDATVCGIILTELLELAGHVYSEMRDSVRCDACDQGVKAHPTHGDH
jgi:hypothetical protein